MEYVLLEKKVDSAGVVGVVFRANVARDQLTAKVAREQLAALYRAGCVLESPTGRRRVDLYLFLFHTSITYVSVVVVVVYGLGAPTRRHWL